MLKVENLSTSYKPIDGDVHVLNDLNFEIHDNEIFGIAGESGCGKTTLLKTLYDIIEFPLEIDKGKVILSGEKNGQSFSYESGNIQKTWWNNISYVPQAAQSVLNPIVRLKKQFLDSIPQEDRKNETKEQTLARVAKYLEELNLSPDILESYPFQLSGGQRQRVAFARALAPNPQVLLLDEPFAAIDAKIRQELRSWLKEMIGKLGITSIFVTHDQDEAIEVADEIIITNAGRIEQKGTPIGVYRNPETAFAASFFGQPSVLKNADDFHTFAQAEGADKIIVRPEFVKISKLDEVEKFKTSVSRGVVEQVSFRGDNLELQVRVNNSVVTARRSLEKADIREGETVNVFLYRIFALRGDSVQLIENEAVRDDFVII